MSKQGAGKRIQLRASQAFRLMHRTFKSGEQGSIPRRCTHALLEESDNSPGPQPRRLRVRAPHRARKAPSSTG